MKIGVLGTGMVGQAIGRGLTAKGHEVMMGSRSEQNDAMREWVSRTGGDARGGTFAAAAASGDLIFNCTDGNASLEVLKAAGSENLAGKVLVDVSNALDFSQGMPPTLAICNDASLGEQIQEAFPDVRVVKSLNTVNAEIMVDPARLKGDHDVFVCGNDESAKSEVGKLLESFGWPPGSIVDLGDITAARAVEMYIPLWLRLMGTVGGTDFNIHVVRS